MRRSIKSVIALLLFSAAAVTRVGAQSPPAAAPLLAGVFVYDSADSEQLELVVDRGVRLVRSPIKRMFARGRIRDMNTPHAWVQIEPRDDSVRVATDLWDVTVPLTGSVLS